MTKNFRRGLIIAGVASSTLAAGGLSYLLDEASKKEELLALEAIKTRFANAGIVEQFGAISRAEGMTLPNFKDVNVLLECRDTALGAEFYVYPKSVDDLKASYKASCKPMLFAKGLSTNNRYEIELPTLALNH